MEGTFLALMIFLAFKLPPIRVVYVDLVGCTLRIVLFSSVVVEIGVVNKYLLAKHTFGPHAQMNSFKVTIL